MKRLRLAAGPFLNIQLRGQERFGNSSFSLSHFPNLQIYSYAEGLETYIGFVAKLGVPIKSKENHEQLLSIQYVHMVDGNLSTGNLEKRFTLSYTLRNFLSYLLQLPHSTP